MAEPKHTLSDLHQMQSLPLYEYIMKPVSQGGLGYKEVIDWLNKNGNLDIRY